MTSIYPSSGSINGGTSVFVSGYNFIEGDNIKCSFGASAVDATYISSSSASCELPESDYAALVDFDISFNGLDFTNSNVQFSYVNNLVIDGFSPTSGSSSGGTLVTITGSNFEFSKYLKCMFGIAEVSASFISSGAIVCVVPIKDDSSEENSVEVSVSNNGLDYVTSTISEFVFVDAVSVDSIDPKRGSTSGGTVITITGSNFASSHDDELSVDCVFKSESTSTTLATTAGTVVDSSTVQCPSPSVSNGLTAYVEVHNLANGIEYESEARIMRHTFVFIEVPIISQSVGNAAKNYYTSTTDESGSTVQIQISGYNFVNTGKAMVCKFEEKGGVSGDAIFAWAAYVSATSLLCPAPTDMFGTFYVSVSFDSKNVWTAEKATVEIFSPVTITRISPAVATSSGSETVTVVGLNFQSTQVHSYDCVFGSVVSPASRVDATHLTCLSPAGDFNGVKFSLSQRGGRLQETDLIYSSLESVQVRAFEPRSVVTEGGTVVSLTVAAEVEEELLYVCSFGGVMSTSEAVKIDATHFSCVSPDLTEVDEGNNVLSLHVKDHVDTKSNFGRRFSFYEAPIISHVFPSYGIEGTR